MPLTRMESRVVELLRRKRMATMQVLCAEVDASHMTVARGLKKHGYYSSINRNASYYTLRETPQFDPQGLWLYREVCFSKHGTLAQTLVTLVENAPAGLTVAEIEPSLHTHVGNLLSRLCRLGELSRCFAGRQAVYLAAQAQRQEQQRRCREAQQEAAATTPVAAQPEKVSFPPQADVVLVLEVLIQIIKTPRADAAHLARTLRLRGVRITTAGIQRILDFYALQKKRHD
jgi:hypothetical protein